MTPVRGRLPSPQRLGQLGSGERTGRKGRSLNRRGGVRQANARSRPSRAGRGTKQRRVAGPAR